MKLTTGIQSILFLNNFEAFVYQLFKLKVKAEYFYLAFWDLLRTQPLRSSMVDMDQIVSLDRWGLGSDVCEGILFQF
jgi:hypothetical protein